MTDRHCAYIVTLERDIREDDAEATITALRQIRGVLNVEPCVTDIDLHVAESRAVHSLRMKLYDFIEKLKL